VSVLRSDRFMTPDELCELARALAAVEVASDRVLAKLNGHARVAWLDRLLPLGSARRTWFVLRSQLAREWGSDEGNPFEGEAWTKLRRDAAEVR